MSNILDEELYKLYEHLDASSLRERLASENNLHNRRIIRSIIRSKTMNSSAVPDTVNGIKEDKIKAQVHTSVSSAPSTSSENDAEIEKLQKRLNQCLNVDERHEIRKQLRELKSHKSSNDSTGSKYIKPEPKTTYRIIDKFDEKRHSPVESKPQNENRHFYDRKKEDNKPDEHITATRTTIEHKSSHNAEKKTPTDNVEKKQKYASYRSMSQEKIQIQQNDVSLQERPEEKPKNTIQKQPTNPAIVEEETIKHPEKFKSYYKLTMSTDAMKEIQEKSPLFKRRTLNDNQERKDDVETKKPVNLKHSATFNVGGDYSKPEIKTNYSKERLELQSKQEVTLAEKDVVKLNAAIHQKIESKFPKSTWYFRDKKISDYPPWYFNKLQIENPKDVKKEDAEYEIQFLKCEKRNHEGTYKLEVEDSKKNWFCEFIIHIKPQPINCQTASQPASSKVEIPKPDTASSVSRETSKPVTRSVTMHETKTIRDETPKPETKFEQPKPAVKVEIPKPDIKVEPAPRHQPVSRIASMKSMFEKQDAPQISPRTTRRTGATSSSSKPGGMDPKELEKLVTSSLYEDEGPQRRPNSNAQQGTSASRPMNSLSTAQSSPTRKTSQVGIIAIVPKLVQKARTAKSSLEAKKQTLIQFCARNTQEYSNVQITNLSGSWANGLAFCALIHHFYPNSFDYSKLTGDDPVANCELAFNTAKREADIEPLMDPEDIVALNTPDWKCVFTYLQSYYSKLRSHPRNVFNNQPPQ